MPKVMGGIRSRTAVLQETAPDPQTPPVYNAALLKLALRLRRPEVSDSPDLDHLLDQVLGQVLGGLEVDRAAFRTYLERNYSFLLAALGQRHM